MAWMEPKTDWKESDYFNAKDYNRFIGNLTVLEVLTEELFKTVDLAPMGEDKTYHSLIYAREINAIENNLETINLNTYGFHIGEKVVYKENGKTPLYSELNRMESAMLKLYTTMQAHKRNLPRLAMTLGGQKGMRV